MRYKNITQIHFSPNGSTKKIVESISRFEARDIVSYDLLRQPLDEAATLEPDTLAIVGVPVYSGRIPEPCAEMLKNLHGRQTPAIAVVVYGNRDYDDALLELKNVLQDNGFLVFAAGAFIAQHSIFPKVGRHRPDAADLKNIEQFAKKCAVKLERLTPEETSVTVKGHFPYKPITTVPLKPSADKNCTACGACARLCPTGAISLERPPQKDPAKCLACGACIAVCPVKAQAFRGFVYKVVSFIFGRKCRVRQEPEIFL